MSVTLRPTSVCDTTPLQRLESLSSNSEPSSPNRLTAANGSCGNTLTNNTNSSNASTDNCLAAGVTNLCGQQDTSSDETVNHQHQHLIGNHTQTPAKAIAAADKALSATVHNNNNHHNNNNTSANNKIDLHLSTFVGTTNHTKMDYRSTRRIFLRIAMDLIILACVGLPIMCFHLNGEGYKRGFFCADQTLRHPYRDSTVHSWMLYLMGFIMPIALITAIEFFKSNGNKMQGFGNLNSNALGTTAATRYYCCHMQIPDWMVECYKKIGALVFGAGVCQLTTEIAKYSVGRLRPHFFEVCRPLIDNGGTCDDPRNVDRYIEDYTCPGDYGVTITKRMLKQVHLSFPSGHANFAFYTMIYMAIYLHQRWTWQRSKMLKHLLQFLLLMFAWYTALTRVSDYKHHWTDVLAGSTIGSLYAVIVTASMW